MPQVGFFAEENDVASLRKRIAELQLENKNLKDKGGAAPVEENKGQPSWMQPGNTAASSLCKLRRGS